MAGMFRRMRRSWSGRASVGKFSENITSLCRFASPATPRGACAGGSRIGRSAGRAGLDQGVGPERLEPSNSIARLAFRALRGIANRERHLTETVPMHFSRVVAQFLLLEPIPAVRTLNEQDPALAVGVIKHSDHALRVCRRRRPGLHLLVALGIAVEGAFEIAQSDDESRPAVAIAVLEQVMLDEGPDAMPERAAHRDPFA